MELIEYNKCSTCQKAENWLEKRNIRYQKRAIRKQTPTYDELKLWIDSFAIPIKKLFNTSGLKYKELHLKELLETMSDEEKIRLLASDGMLIKRPLLLCEDALLVGFKESEWEAYFAKKG